MFINLYINLSFSVRLVRQWLANTVSLFPTVACFHVCMMNKEVIQQFTVCAGWMIVEIDLSFVF